MREDEFVPYQEALQMRRLGYDAVPFGNYIIIDEKPVLINHCHTNAEISVKPHLTEICNAPLWQQAFDWFRETYLFKSAVIPRDDVFVKNTNLARPFESAILTTYGITWVYGCDEYESAREALLKELVRMAQNLKDLDEGKSIEA